MNSSIHYGSVGKGRVDDSNATTPVDNSIGKASEWYNASIHDGLKVNEDIKDLF